MTEGLRTGIARRVVLAIAAAVALAASVVLGWRQLAHAPAASMVSNDPRILAQGREVYAQHCASCHGARLEGQDNWRARLPNGRLPAPPHDASGHTWHHPAQQLFGIVKNGPQAYAPAGYESDMPAYRGVLSDPAIWSVLAYIRSTWPEDIQHRHASIDRASRSR